MGTFISRLDEDLGPLGYRLGHDALVMLDITDILEDIIRTINSHHATPVFASIDHLHLESWLFDLYNELGYLPWGVEAAQAQISNLLDTASQYFDGEMSALERLCWHTASARLVERLQAYRMYTTQENIHEYDFHTYANGVLYLRRP